MHYEKGSRLRGPFLREAALCPFRPAGWDNIYWPFTNAVKQQATKFQYNEAALCAGASDF
jgi:hypothetical protein